MDRPRPWLRYLNADDLDDTSVRFAGMKVENAQGEKLGTVDGFIIDVDTARPYYVVVDSGGWFKSKHYLVPVGHARLDGERGVMLADLTRERIKRFPGFDKDEFVKLSDQELEQFAQSTASACGVNRDRHRERRAVVRVAAALRATGLVAEQLLPARTGWLGGRDGGRGDAVEARGQPARARA